MNLVLGIYSGIKWCIIRVCIFLFLLLNVNLTSLGQNALLDKSFLKPEKDRVLKIAEKFKDYQPITIVNYPAVRSAGGINDFYSEGDYWWPDSVNPYGPYIQKDGMTNPDNFTKHREVMIRFSQISGALGSAYLATGDQQFAEKLRPHFMAWFVDENTLMNPTCYMDRQS